jgi:NADP-reducing hydrogenase subunit HndC
MGAGAFVCGEETALMASIEGRRGEPRPRPPFPANEGLWNKPTLLNNVETYANIPAIILNGAEWYASMGTETTKGTKVFALAGHVNNTGLVEVPMGSTLGRVIFEIGGGIRGGRGFKAAQSGGPSGGCIPMEHLNTPIDYRTNRAASARRVGSAPGGCWRSWSGSAAARAARATSSCWWIWASRSTRPRCAGWARPRRTRS